MLLWTMQSKNPRTRHVRKKDNAFLDKGIKLWNKFPEKVKLYKKAQGDNSTNGKEVLQRFIGISKQSHPYLVTSLQLRDRARMSVVMRYETPQTCLWHYTPHIQVFLTLLPCQKMCGTDVP